MRKRVLVGVVLIALAPIGLYLGAHVGSRNPLVLSPAESSLPAAMVDGDKPEMQITVKNRSSRPITIKEIQTSCGCMVAVPPGAAMPFDIAAYGSTLLDVRIDSTKLFGNKTFKLLVTAQSANGRHYHAEASFEGYIRCSLQAIPSTVVLDVLRSAEFREATVMLADELAGKGVAVAAVRTSSPSLVAELVPAEGTSSFFGATLRNRYRVVIRYRSDSWNDRVEEIISIVPNGGRFRTLTIPVTGRVRDAFEFEPKLLVLQTGKPGETLSREVICRMVDASNGRLAVLSAPENVRVTISQEHGCNRVRIECIMPEKLGSSGTEIVFGLGSERRPAPFPLYLTVRGGQR